MTSGHNFHIIQGNLSDNIHDNLSKSLESKSGIYFNPADFTNDNLNSLSPCVCCCFLTGI